MLLFFSSGGNWNLTNVAGAGMGDMCNYPDGEEYIMARVS